MKSLIAALVIIACHQVTWAKESALGNQLTNVDRVIIFAVQQEVRASQLENRKDVCVGLGRGLESDEKGIISELHRRGLELHANEWCNRGPRGLVVSVFAPITGSLPGTFEIEVKLGDLRPISQHGEHFATLLRRGVYVVNCKDNSEPVLVRYGKTCCPETPNPKR